MTNWYSKTKNLLTVILISCAFVLQAASPDNGKALFKSKCASCHAKDMKSAATGPALGGVVERWAKYPKKDLYDWIKDSQAQIKSGHPKATELWEKYKPMPMLANPDMTDAQIDDILAFINGVADGSYGAKKKSSGGGTKKAGFSEGKSLFKAKCAACHAKDMKSAATGPALGGVVEKWGDSKEDLYSWIRNSQALIKSGNPKAVEIWNQYKPVPMTSFPDLSDEEIANLLTFIEDTASGVAKGSKASVASVAGTEGTSKNGWLIYGLMLVLGIFSLFLWKIISKMTALEQVEATGKAVRPQSLKSVLNSKQAWGIYNFLIIVVGGYYTVINATNLGRQQGYAPEQPIHFSHKIHSGDNKIDCKYCHDGARRSKHSVIPAMNTCMNCHAAIKVGSKDGTQELTKIYAAVGYNPSTGKYIDDYENMSEEDIKSIFTEWIESNNEGDALAPVKQWEGIKAALTNDQKKTIPGAVEWKRVHNLPDHVYYNHAQHVTVGKLDCAVCHGKIEEMDVVEQHSTLGMGWCISCHRETEVPGFNNSKYYESYTLFHKQMKEGKREKVTVADIGGLECAKCHY